MSHDDIYIHGRFADVIRLNMFQGQMQKWWYYIESGRIMQILGLYLIGLVLGRVGFFSRPEAFTTTRRVIMAAAAIVGLGLFFANPVLTGLVPHPPGQFEAQGLVRQVIESLINLSQMVFAVMLLVELYFGIGQGLLRLLAPAGRITLTLYIMQAVVFVPLYYGFGLGLHGKLAQSTALEFGVAFFLGQLVFAHFWFRYFQ